MAKVSDAPNKRLPMYEPKGDYASEGSLKRAPFDRRRWLDYLASLERREVPPKYRPLGMPQPTD